MNTLNDFLSTFNDPAAQTQEQAPPAAPPPASPEASVPVSALPGILAAARHQQAIEQSAIRPTPVAPPAAPPPASTPVVQSVADQQLAQRLHALEEQNRLLAQSLHRAELQSYRASVISAARANGIELVDALVIGGTREEIDASVQIAAAEYRMLREQILRNAGAAAAPQAASAPVGTVASAGSAPTAPSLPSAHNPANLPPEPANGGMTAEQLAYLTSPTAQRNGDYARNRHLIFAALQSMSGNGPQAQPFQAAPQLGIAAPQTNLGVVPNPFAGVTFPQVNGVLGRNAPAQVGLPSSGRPPQPSDFDIPVPGQPGRYAPNPNAGPIDAASARRAAEASVAQARARVNQ